MFCRLDAIGAVGIARCFTYGGRFNRILHDPAILPRENLTKEAYKTGEQTTINHFYEKLLKLKVSLLAGFLFNKSIYLGIYKLS